jgi:hypothetical protein
MSRRPPPITRFRSKPIRIPLPPAMARLSPAEDPPRTEELGEEFAITPGRPQSRRLLESP